MAKKTKYVVVTRKHLKDMHKAMEAALNHISWTSEAIRGAVGPFDIDYEKLALIKEAIKVYDKLDVAASTAWRLSEEKNDER